MLSSRFSIAPMMEWTDRHCRSFHRILAPSAVLYTEMVNQGAVLHGKRDQLLGFDAAEHPVVLQLGGSDPAKLAEAAKIGVGYGYDAINLNCGCPSDRVQAGRFGACLMAEPQLVAKCVSVMRSVVGIPVTVKTRIGIDDSEGYDFLRNFVTTVAEAGCETFIIHARKAWLKGLSPRENREVPPLDYPMAYRLKQDLPQLTVIVNGGITSPDQAQEHLAHCDGVMIGRAAYQDPYCLTGFERMLSGSEPPSRFDICERYRPYIAARLAEGTRLHAMTRPMQGLFNGIPGGRAWRHILSEQAVRPGAGLEVLDRALDAVRQEELREAA
jgi:tRNA-dihydrouridine synthase A